MGVNLFTVAGFFAGVGGIERGFERAGFNVVWANEFDKWACKTFRINHKETTLAEKSIIDIHPDEVPPVDVYCGGFPCQTFSVMGRREGFADERGNMFFELARIVKANRPRAILLENVKNLVTHDKGNTFKVILDTLQKDLGYTVFYKVLGASEYGNLPQSRERIFVVCFRDLEDAQGFEWCEPIPLTRRVRDLVDYVGEVDEKYYYDSFVHYETLDEGMDDPEAVYQWRIGKKLRKNKSGVCPTLLASMGTGGNNVPLIRTDSGRIRKLTQQECFNLQGYPEIVLPGLTQREYKQAGNSVAVDVVERVAVQIKKALESCSKKSKQ